MAKLEIEYEYDYKGYVIRQVPLLDGVKHGIEVVYSSNTLLKRSETSYVHGKIHGEHIVYYNSGNICKRTQYVNGVNHGYDRIYSDGDKSYIQIECIYENGRIIKMLSYDDDGMIIAMTSYKKENEGYTKRYNDKESLYQIYSFKRNVLHGICYDINSVTFDDIFPYNLEI